MKGNYSRVVPLEEPHRAVKVVQALTARPSLSYASMDGWAGCPPPPHLISTTSQIQNSSPLDMEETHGDEDVSPPASPWALERMLQAQQLESPHQSPDLPTARFRNRRGIGSRSIGRASHGNQDQDRC